MFKRVAQINNLRIYQVSDFGNKYVVKSPDGRLLEEFRYLPDAKLWCKKTKDFLKRNMLKSLDKNKQL